MDVIDNKHFERVQAFVGSEDLEVKLSRNGSAELPWRMEILKYEKSKYVAHSMTFSGVLKLVSNWVQQIQAHSVDYDLPVSSFIEPFELPSDIDQMIDDVRVESNKSSESYDEDEVKSPVAEALIEIEHTDGHTKHPKSEF